MVCTCEISTWARHAGNQLTWIYAKVRNSVQLQKQAPQRQLNSQTAPRRHYKELSVTSFLRLLQ